MAGESLRRLGAGAPDALLRHQLVHLVVQRGRCAIDQMPASIAFRAPASVCTWPSTFMLGLRGFADDQPDLVGRVAVRLAVHADLDHARAEQHVLPDRP